MSSLFDAPAHLIMMLAAVVAGQQPADSPLPLRSPAAVAAQGPYAFSESMWLTAVRQGLGGASFEPYRGRIFATSAGRLYVPVLSERQGILAARQSPEMSQAVAVDLARFHAGELRSRLGRPAAVKDLYAAHMFGLDIAARLAGLNAIGPETLAVNALSEIAVAFPADFMRRGVPITVAEFYRRLPDAQDLSPSVAVNTMAPIDRAAPLRGIIKEADRPSESAEVSSKADQIAGLEPPVLNWTTQVRRAQ